MSLLKRAWVGMITSIMTCSLSKLASYISTKLILDRIADLCCEWSSSIGHENLSRERSIRAKNTQAMSQLPTLWDADQRYARTSMICQQMLRLCHNKWAYVSYFGTSTQYRLVCFDCQMASANEQCCISHNDMPRILRCTWTSIIWAQKLPLCHK